MTDKSDPVALVTGASKRIGASICRTLHCKGYRVAIHYGSSTAAAANLAAELNAIRPDSADIFQADLCELESTHAISDELLGRWGKINAVINNASTFYPTPLASSEEQDWNNLLNSNVKGPYFLIKYLATSLRENRGTIVNIADINIRFPLKNYPIYCIAKAANVMLTKSLARELAPDVRVNGVAPGSILWPEGKAEMSDDTKSRLLAKIPLQRMGDPNDIAELVCFLACTPGYITGQVIAVDGGLNLNGDHS